MRTGGRDSNDGDVANDENNDANDVSNVPTVNRDSRDPRCRFCILRSSFVDLDIAAGAGTRTHPHSRERRQDRTKPNPNPPHTHLNIHSHSRMLPKPTDLHRRVVDLEVAGQLAHERIGGSLTLEGRGARPGERVTIHDSWAADGCCKLYSTPRPGRRIFKSSLAVAPEEICLRFRIFESHVSHECANSNA